MVCIEPEQKLYFQGTDSPAAFVEVKIYGSAGRAEYDALTAKITSIINSSLDIAPGRIYVKYEEVENWGFNGHNFWSLKEAFSQTYKFFQKSNELLWDFWNADSKKHVKFKNY